MRSMKHARTTAAIAATLAICTLGACAARNAAQPQQAHDATQVVGTSSTVVDLPTGWACGAPLESLPTGYSEPVAWFTMCLRYEAEQGIIAAEDAYGFDACTQGDGTGTRPDGLRCQGGLIVASTGQAMTTPIT